MSEKDPSFPRSDTDASLLTERQNTDRELNRRVVVADADADEVLRVARERADRLLQAARAAADARLPLSEQTEAAVALLLSQREEEDGAVASEREQADERLEREREERRAKLSALLMLERKTTDLHLALERRSADTAVASRDDFLAQASHDLRALLASQKIYFALLLRTLGDSEVARTLSTHLATLSKINAQMDRMVSDLVDIVAIDAGKLTVKLGSRSTNDLLSTTTAVFEPLARERRQSLTLSLLPTDVRVVADSERAIQVLGNLLSNAIKFTPAGGQIRVCSELHDDHVALCVEDSGPGIASDQAKNIFKRFVGSSGSSAGLGLGLYIAHRLVESHGGQLTFESDPGHRTVFRFTLLRASD